MSVISLIISSFNNEPRQFIVQNGHINSTITQEM